jgi:hypothetical protein
MLEAEVKEIAGVRISLASPRALYRLKKDTVRPIDRQDAAMLRRGFDLEDEERPGPARAEIRIGRGDGRSGRSG